MSQGTQLPLWASYFKIDDATWATLCQEAQKNHGTPLDVALDLGLLNENKLLAWDCHHSGLASLRTVFFNGQAPLELWENQDFYKCREQACMPVGQWDDKIIWAKILSTPVSGETANDPSRIWVLAPWSGMKKWFAQWQALIAPPVAKIEPQTDQGINITFDAPAGLKIDYDVKKAEDLIVGKLEDQMPVGLGKSDQEVAIDFSNIGLMNDDDHSTGVAPTVMAPAVPSTPPTQVPTAPAAPEPAAFDLDISFEGLSVEHEQAAAVTPPAPVAPVVPVIAQAHPIPAPTGQPIQVASPAPPTIPNLAPISRTLQQAAPPPQEIPVTAKKSSVQPPPIPLDAHSMPGIVVPPTLKKTTPPPPPTTASRNESHVVVPIMAPSPAVAFPVAAPIPAPAQNLNGGFSVETNITPPPGPVGDLPTIPLDQLEPRLKLATNQDSLTQVFMGAWQNYFDKIMILLVQSETLMMWRHNYRWRGQVPRGEKIPLDGPSIFKIVMDSLHPYHGYISPSDINDLFFQKINAGEYPEHISVIPVVSGEHVVTVLVGTCSKSTGNTLVLSRLENDAQTFAAAMARVQSLPKKVG